MPAAGTRTSSSRIVVSGSLRCRRRAGRSRSRSRPRGAGCGGCPRPGRRSSWSCWPWSCLWSCWFWSCWFWSWLVLVAAGSGSAAALVAGPGCWSPLLLACPACPGPGPAAGPAAGPGCSWGCLSCCCSCFGRCCRSCCWRSCCWRSCCWRSCCWRSCCWRSCCWPVLLLAVLLLPAPAAAGPAAAVAARSGGAARPSCSSATAGPGLGGLDRLDELGLLHRARAGDAHAGGHRLQVGDQHGAEPATALLRASRPALDRRWWIRWFPSREVLPTYQCRPASGRRLPGHGFPAHRAARSESTVRTARGRDRARTRRRSHRGLVASARQALHRRPRSADVACGTRSRGFGGR